MIKTEIIFIAILVLLCACGNREKYDRLLAEADSLNQNYIPFTTDSTMLDVVDYYNHHGTANERMKAHYLLGCVYRDLGEAPRALECYHDAVDCADTTSQDCDYKLLSRVYSQTGGLFLQEMALENALMSFNSACKYSKIAKDTLAYLFNYATYGSIYDDLDKTDSVIIIGKNASRLFRKYNYMKESAQSLAPVIHQYIKLGLYEKARECMEYYEKYSGIEDPEISRQHSTYLYLQGKYYLHVNQLDAAEKSFRKELLLSSDLNDQRNAYSGLVDVFNLKHQADSVHKYSSLLNIATDKYLRSLSMETIQQMQSLYDYSRHQQLAQQKEKEVSRLYIWGLWIIIILLISCYFLISYIKRTKDRKYQAMKLLLEGDIDLLEETKTELEELLKTNTDEYTQEIQEKESLITELKVRIRETADHHRQIKKTALENRLLSSRIYSKFRAYADKPLKRPTMKDWSDLRNMMNHEYPSFYAFLVVRHDVSIADFDIYILYRLHFRLTDIANLTGLNASTINTKRKRLFKSIYHREGTTDEIVSFIMEIE